MPNPAPVTERDFDAPIMGASLTGELGAKPYEQPATLPSVEENLDYYMEALLSPAMMPRIAANLERGRRVSDFAEFLVTSGVAEGRHTIDVGVLVLPTIIEMIALIGDMYDIDFDMGLEARSEESKDSFIEVAEAALSKAEDEEDGYVASDMNDVELEEEPEAEEPPVPEPASLMARR